MGQGGFGNHAFSIIQKLTLLIINMYRRPRGEIGIIKTKRDCVNVLLKIKRKTVREETSGIFTPFFSRDVTIV
jgi:hypothetical protein